MFKFKEWIKEKGKTQEDVARDLGVAQGLISSWCNGERLPRAENMQKIIKYTGGEVTANDFYGVKELSEQ